MVLIDIAHFPEEDLWLDIFFQLSYAALLKVWSMAPGGILLSLWGQNYLSI